MTARSRAFVALMALAALSACATKSNLVVVLPEDDGHVGAVVVHDANGNAVLDKAYAAEGAGAGGGALQPVKVDAQEVSQIFGTTLAAQPIPPKSYTLYFISDSDQLTDASKAEFEAVFEEVSRRKAAEVVVTGNTDTVGKEEYNDKLSLKRAEAVRQLFIARGLAPDAVIAAGRGERELLVATADDVAEEKNRRVVITVR